MKNNVCHSLSNLTKFWTKVSDVTQTIFEKTNFAIYINVTCLFLINFLFIPSLAIQFVCINFFVSALPRLKFFICLCNIHMNISNICPLF